MTPLRLAYLCLAIWGAAHPMFHLLPWMGGNGFSLSALIAAWQANGAVAGLFWDLTISALALTLWILAEVSARRNWSGLLAVPATFLIGVSCGLPLYLFLRTRLV